MLLCLPYPTLSSGFQAIQEMMKAHGQELVNFEDIKVSHRSLGLAPVV